MTNDNYYKYLEARDKSKEGNNKEALNLLKEIYEEEPYDNTVKFAIIKTLIKCGKTDEALELLDNILENGKPYEQEFALFEHGIIAAKNKEVEKAYEYLLPLTEKDNRFKYNALFHLGKLEIYKQNLDKAKEYFLPIINSCTKPIERRFATFELGKIEMSQGNLEKAREYFLPLLNETKKDRAFALHKLGQLEIKANNYDKAREYLKLLLKNDNKQDKSFALFELGSLEQNLGNLKEASKYFTKLDELENNIQTKSNQNSNLSDGEKLRDNLESFAESTNTKIKNYGLIELGKHQAKRGNLYEAKEYFLQILEDGNEKEMAFASLELGKIEIRLGNYDKACEYLEPLKSDIYINNAVYFELGKLEFGKGNTQQAIEYLNKLLNTTIKDFAKFELVKIYISNEDYENALKYSYELLESEEITKDKVKKYIDYSKYKLGLLKEEDIKDEYFYKQLTNYDKDLAIYHIKNNLNLNGVTLKYSELDNDLDIEELYDEVLYILPEIEKKNIGIYDKYLYDYGATIGKSANKRTSVIAITTWSNTNQILTIYPVAEKSKNYVRTKK